MGLSKHMAWDKVIRSSMTYLSLFFHALVILPPLLADRSSVHKANCFFPLKVKPLLCETGCASKTKSEAEADTDNIGTETLSKSNPITSVVEEVIPGHFLKYTSRNRMIGAVFEWQNSHENKAETWSSIIDSGTATSTGQWEAHKGACCGQHTRDCNGSLKELKEG